MDHDETPDEEGFIEWAVRLDSISFSTKVYTDPDTTSSDAEATAFNRFLNALQNGNVTPTWKTTAKTREDIHSEALYMYSQVCTYCNTYTEEEKREIVVDDTVGFVCPSCADELRDICNECKRHRDDLDEDETIEITGHTVVEFICSSCYTEELPTAEA